MIDSEVRQARAMARAYDALGAEMTAPDDAAMCRGAAMAVTALLDGLGYGDDVSVDL